MEIFPYELTVLIQEISPLWENANPVFVVLPSGDLLKWKLNSIVCIVYFSGISCFKGTNNKFTFLKN